VRLAIRPNYCKPSSEWRIYSITLLRKGQQEGGFRAFDLHVMAVTIRRAIDALPPFFIANPNLDADGYARELVTLFDRATRKE
jgi:hypothetical protein